MKQSPAGDAAKQVAISALRAIRKCAPFSDLPASQYADWKDVTINFVPNLTE